MLGGPDSNLIGGIFIAAAVVLGIRGLVNLRKSDDRRFWKYLLGVGGYVVLLPFALSLHGGLGTLLVVWAALFFPFCLFLLRIGQG
jgi:Ca2+/Na+ antiporter